MNTGERREGYRDIKRMRERTEVGIEDTKGIIRRCISTCIFQY
jgi:hypothetical protein